MHSCTSRSAKIENNIFLNTTKEGIIMKKSILFLLGVSLFINVIADAEKNLTKEEKWQKTKEVLWSGEVAYGILGIILTFIAIRYFVPWWSQRIGYNAALKKMALLKPILKRQESKLDKEAKFIKFCVEELKFPQDQIAYSINDDKRMVTIKLVKPELRENPNLKKFFNILYTAKMDDESIGKIVSSTIHDNVGLPEGVISEISAIY